MGFERPLIGFGRGFWHHHTRAAILMTCDLLVDNLGCQTSMARAFYSQETKRLSDVLNNAPLCFLKDGDKYVRHVSRYPFQYSIMESNRSTIGVDLQWSDNDNAIARRLIFNCDQLLIVIGIVTCLTC